MPILLAESSGPTASRSSHTIGRRRWADCKPKCQQGVAESAKHRPTSPIHRPISLWPTSSRKGGFRLFLARPIYSLLFVVGRRLATPVQACRKLFEYYFLGELNGLQHLPVTSSSCYLRKCRICYSLSTHDNRWWSPTVCGLVPPILELIISYLT